VEVSERARRNLSAILRALATVGQVRAAERMGVSESTLSRMKDADLQRIADLLAACGLKVVGEDLKLYQPERIAAILELARLGIDRAAEPSEFGDNL